MGKTKLEEADIKESTRGARQTLPSKPPKKKGFDTLAALRIIVERLVKEHEGVVVEVGRNPFGDGYEIHFVSASEGIRTIMRCDNFELAQIRSPEEFVKVVEPRIRTAVNRMLANCFETRVIKTAQELNLMRTRIGSEEFRAAIDVVMKSRKGK